MENGCVWVPTWLKTDAIPSGRVQSEVRCARLGQSTELAKIKLRIRIGTAPARRSQGTPTVDLRGRVKTEPGQNRVNHARAPKHGPSRRAGVASNNGLLCYIVDLLYPYLRCKQFLRRHLSLSFALKLRFMFDSIFRKLSKNTTLNKREIFYDEARINQLMCQDLCG